MGKGPDGKYLILYFCIFGGAFSHTNRAMTTCTIYKDSRGFPCISQDQDGWLHLPPTDMLYE